MQRLQKISSLVAILLLLVAFLGQAPRQWLHTAIADHTDVHHASTTQETLYAQAFQCDVAQQAVTASFILPANITVQSIFASGASPDAPAFASKYCHTVSVCSLRGPPVA